MTFINIPSYFKKLLSYINRQFKILSIKYNFMKRKTNFMKIYNKLDLHISATKALANFLESRGFPANERAWLETPENLWAYTLGPLNAPIQSEAVLRKARVRLASHWIGALKGRNVCAQRFSRASSLLQSLHLPLVREREHLWVPGKLGMHPSSNKKSDLTLLVQDSFLVNSARTIPSPKTNKQTSITKWTKTATTTTTEENKNDAMSCSKSQFWERVDTHLRNHPSVRKPKLNLSLYLV